MSWQNHFKGLGSRPHARIAPVKGMFGTVKTAGQHNPLARAHKTPARIPSVIAVEVSPSLSRAPGAVVVAKSTRTSILDPGRSQHGFSHWSKARPPLPTAPMTMPTRPVTRPRVRTPLTITSRSNNRISNVRVITRTRTCRNLIRFSIAGRLPEPSGGGSGSHNSRFTTIVRTYCNYGDPIRW
jgi:hypothetical protein